ncbi:C2 domain-containing protein [Dioscorea alata]|uniref:C2 domain-containing protein n=4 Tax=Dioscorea alata TaxID=55571 RepID=A0ACB7UJJ7_DIOAL|nr:C2 domain-containing protein [Dioscorea alata]KAH7660559.1 C2 domain-containing protein [Dioscorea alata]KAH7660560.1 C2 domain-containing protein [Dioscorea alata]KAH7660561.1 C2 domain-containing protein [Dioscorea alata]
MLGAGGSIMEPPYPPLDPRLNKPAPTTSDEAIKSETPASEAAALAAAAAAAAVGMPPVTTSSCTSDSISISCGNGDEAMVMGVLEVLIHQARDIHNICIYHKQDVYAKLYLTSDSHLTTVSTRIINGGGRNPVFNDSLRLNVRTLDSSLKCEIWMLSRARNYLEDQLLGFALVPLSDVVLATNATLNQEFSLSSTDLFHSPAGFVQLSLSYHGSFSPELMSINDTTLPDACCTDNLHVPVMLDKIEFPDLKVVNENQMMVSEYFGIPCSSTLESESPQSLISSQNGANLNEGDDAAGVRVVESFSTGSNGAANKHENDTTNGTPLSSVSNSMTCSAETGACPSLKDKIADVSEGEVDSTSLSSGAGAGEGDGGGAGGISPLVSDKGFPTPIIKIDNIEPEETVKQQEIVDMYMKSMQQFTESLAKMKLPMDIENNAQIVENQNSENSQSHVSKGTTGSRVFYGSRAFF